MLFATINLADFAERMKNKTSAHCYTAHSRYLLKPPAVFSKNATKTYLHESLNHSFNHNIKLGFYWE